MKKCQYLLCFITKFVYRNLSFNLPNIRLDDCFILILLIMSDIELLANRLLSSDFTSQLSSVYPSELRTVGSGLSFFYESISSLDSSLRFGAEFIR